jgi:hypothetical protein
MQQNALQRKGYIFALPSQAVFDHQYRLFPEGPI